MSGQSELSPATAIKAIAPSSPKSTYSGQLTMAEGAVPDRAWGSLDACLQRDGDPRSLLQFVVGLEPRRDLSPTAVDDAAVSGRELAQTSGIGHRAGAATIVATAWLWWLAHDQHGVKASSFFECLRRCHFTETWSRIPARVWHRRGNVWWSYGGLPFTRHYRMSGHVMWSGPSASVTYFQRRRGFTNVFQMHIFL